MLAAGAVSAQKVIVRPVPVAPRVIYYSRPYYNPYYNPYLYGGLGYTWYSRPAYYNHPTKMEIKIQDIENDYKDRIASVRADDSLAGKERREKIHDLKHECDQEISDFKKSYYKQYEN